MTKWQTSCIDALVTSPIAFKLWRDSQHNKKAVDQFINKIWPYILERKETKVIIQKPTATKSKYKDIAIFFGLVKQWLENYNRSDRFQVSEEEGLNLVLFAKFYHENLADLNRTKEIPYDGNNLMDLETYIGGSRNRSAQLGRSRRFGLNIAEASCSLEEYERKLRRIDMQSGICRKQEMIDIVLTQVNLIIKLAATKKKKIKETKVKTPLIFKGLNIGIEIEYENGEPKCQELKPRLLQLHAVDFHSGWDGNNRLNETDRGDRLRENRLRINGHKGLQALYFLLGKMMENGNQITNNSGMHFHVDSTKAFKTLERSQKIRLIDVLKDALKEMSSQDRMATNHIFKIDGGSHTTNTYIHDYMIERIKYQPDFGTLEWRMASATLDFRTLAIQILYCIHLTQVMKYKNKKINSKYINTLSLLQTNR